MIALKTVLLLAVSNEFMLFAWYGHLKNFAERPPLTHLRGVQLGSFDQNPA